MKMSFDRFRPPASQTPLVRNEQGEVLCRFCFQPVRPPRKTFCSNRCVEKWRMQSDGSFVRSQLYGRDRGICAYCQIDCVKQRRKLITKPKECFTIRSQWQAHHHVVSVREGGGQCGLEGYITLCLKCHAVETTKQHKHRSREYRVKRLLEILTIIKGMRDLGATTDQLMFATDLSSTTVSNYLKVLRRHEYLSQEMRGKPHFLTDKGSAALKKVKAKTAKSRMHPD